MEGFGDALVRPARTVFDLIRHEQDLGVLETAHIRLAPGQQALKLRALLARERHPVLLEHGWPPVGSNPHQNRKTPNPSLQL
jgi:hypothetical protein